jgi:hypothetical protein
VTVQTSRTVDNSENSENSENLENLENLENPENLEPCIIRGCENNLRPLALVPPLRVSSCCQSQRAPTVAVSASSSAA